MQDVFLLINFGDRAHAGGALLDAFETILREHGGRYRIERSKSIEHGHSLIAQAHAEGFARLIVGGGDGTLYHIINHPLTPRIPLGILPLGTVNALAASLGLEKRAPADALRRVLAAPCKDMDIARVEERRFACFGGVGYDAEVVHRTGGWFKKAFRQGAFGAIGVVKALGYRHLPEFTLEIPGHAEVKTRLFIFSNIPIFAGARLFRAHVTSGALEGVALRGVGFFPLLRFVRRAAAGPPGEWTRRLPDVATFENFREARVHSADTPPRVQLDGEPFTPRNPRRIEFVLEPASQPFLVPEIRERRER